MGHDRRVSVIGLGYVGLPVAVAFGRSSRVIGFDISQRRVNELKAGVESTREVEPADLAASDILFTFDPADLADADFHIVTVPTPLTETKQPDLKPLESASKTVGKILKKGDIVVFESTVYPGVTEEFCGPILAAESGLVCGKDFFLGYSPERINPGDKVHRLETITKVVSGQTPEICDIVAAVYGSVVTAGVHAAPTIKTAEAAKVIENTQRDLNIALMNELAIIFDRMGIDTKAVLTAAGTKWNFLPFSPGLVGGHCIGIDPYYLTFKSEQMGYHPQLILAGRRINDGMGQYIARETVKRLFKSGPGWGDRRPLVTILGFTFKENVPDYRNTRVIDIIEELQAFDVTVQVTDPHADPADVRAEYGVDLVPESDVAPADAVILAVAHEAYRGDGWPGVCRFLREDACLVIDVKGTLDPGERPEAITSWRL
ncbi:MAG: nucleotide sugar dehydrogenase [Magnetospiraceae bacterium]